ncbi:MAG: DUF4192 domain-containing protein [Mycobacteriales bacterium]
MPADDLWTGAPPTIRGPAELIECVPYLLGFTPHDSLVVVGLCDRGAQVVVTARIDWPDLADPGGRRRLVAALRNVGTESVILVAYTTSASGATTPGVLVRRHLRTMRKALRGKGFEVPVALAVDGARWQALGELESSWPRSGELTAAGPSVAATELVAQGANALPDREALADTLAPLPEGDRLRPIGPLDPAAADAPPAMPELSPAERGDHLRLWQLLVQSMVGGEWEVPAATAATVVRALRDLALRDAACSYAALPEAAAAETLARHLARRAPDRFAAPAYAVTAWLTWQRGAGVAAGIAAEHAVRDEPGYGLAGLILTALEHGLPPEKLDLADYDVWGEAEAS